jgi:arylsulfatase A-like enzyme
MEDARELNSAFARWADRGWDSPTFVWIHYLDPHGPYTPPAELEALFIDDEWSRSPERVPLRIGKNPLRKKGRNKVLGAIPRYQRQGSEDRRAVYIARYDAEIRLVDEAFGEILRILKDRQLYDGSAVVFASDHGESLGEHSYYFEHGWFAYEPTLRIPLLIKWPGQTSGETRAGVASLLDLLPTILAVSGAPPATPAGRGADLRTAPRDRPPLAVESSDKYPVKFAGLRSPDWKYLVSETDGAEELYDLADDPNEIENLAGRAPPALSELRLAWQHFRDETPLAGDVWGPDGARNPTIDEPLDEETRRSLEELGYLEPSADP